MPIFRVDGSFFGALCAIDPRPSERLEDANIVATLELFAQLIGAQLESEDSQARSSAALDTALDTATRREESISLAGHQLQEPVQRIVMATYLLKTIPGLDPDARIHVMEIEEGAARIAEMIGGILDAGLARIHDNQPMSPAAAGELTHLLRTQLAGIAASHPGRAISASVRVDHAVYCDPRRITRLLAHLLAEVLGPGDALHAVEVDVHSDPQELSMEVARRGAALPPPPDSNAMFHAGEIAKAHGGAFEVTAFPDLHRIVFRMPLVAAG